MNPQTYNLLMGLLTLAGSVLALYGIYFGLTALFGLKKQKAVPHAEPATRFAVVVAARNEQAVIGNLVDSLAAQNYPRELYNIIVAPNNCTDDTRGEALRHGAQVFDPKGRITGKGDVLTQVVDAMLARDDYDALCVFDADNLAHPDFLQKMNDIHQSGVQVAQGFRDSKNLSDTAVSTCYSVCYWMFNRFYNGGRQALGFSAQISGSGFMVSTEMLRQLGGWHTHTMTEDYEFTAQCVMRGKKVHYVADAVIYDEQPLTFTQSWKQRRRWSTGTVQGMDLHLTDLVRTGIRQRRWSCIDLAITYSGPLVQLVSMIIGLCSAGLLALGAFSWHLLPVIPLINLLVGAVALVAFAFLVCTALAALMVWLFRGKLVPGTGKGIACFALFLLTWVPIGLISLFKPTTTWDAIAHTRAVALGEIERS